MTKLSLESIYGDADFPMECPACKHNFTFKFKLALNDGNVIKCPGCNQDIKLEHDETTKQTIENATKQLEEFNETWKALGKTMKKFGK